MAGTINIASKQEVVLKLKEQSTRKEGSRDILISLPEKQPSHQKVF